MPNKLEKNRFRMFLFSGILILLIVLFFIIRFIFNHPVVQYSEAEIKTFDRIIGIVSQYNGEQDDLVERLQREEHEINSMITGKIDFPDNHSFSQIVDWVQGLLPTTQFQITRYHHPETLQTNLSLNVLLQKINLIDINLYQDDEITAIQSPILLDKSIGLHNEKLDLFLEKFAIKSPLDALPNFMQWQNENLTTREAFGHVKNYISIFLEGIKNAEIELTEDVIFNGAKFNHYEAYLNEEDAKSIITAILNELVEVEQFNYFFNLFHKDEDVFQQLLNEFDLIQLPNGVHFEAYFYDEYVVKRKLYATIVLGGKEFDFTLLIDTAFNNDDEFDLNGNFSINIKDGKHYFIDFIMKGKPSSETFHIERTIHIGSEENSNLFTIEVNSEYDNDKTETYITVVPSLNGDSIKFIAQLINKTSMNEDEGMRHIDGQFGIDLTDETSKELESYLITFSIDENITFNNNFEHSIIEKDEILFIDQLDAKEIQLIIDDIKNEVMNYVEQLIRKFIPFF